MRWKRSDPGSRARFASDPVAGSWLATVCAEAIAVDAGAGLVLFGSRAAGTCDRHSDFDLAVGLGAVRPTAPSQRLLTRLAARDDHLLTVVLGPAQAGSVFVAGGDGFSALRCLDLHLFDRAGLGAALRDRSVGPRTVLRRPDPVASSRAAAVDLGAVACGPAVAAWWALAAGRRVLRRDVSEAEELLIRARIALADALRAENALRGGASGSGLAAIDRRRLLRLRPVSLRTADLRSAVASTLRAARATARRLDDGGLAARIGRLQQVGFGPR